MRVRQRQVLIDSHVFRDENVIDLEFFFFEKCGELHFAHSCALKNDVCIKLSTLVDFSFNSIFELENASVIVFFFGMLEKLA